MRVNAGSARGFSGRGCSVEEKSACGRQAKPGTVCCRHSAALQPGQPIIVEMDILDLKVAAHVLHELRKAEVERCSRADFHAVAEIIEVENRGHDRADAALWELRL